MKSLLSIINKLSQSEIDTFRVFLKSHGRSNRNKKLELFNHIVNHPSETPETEVRGSRQSLYQLKKRLQEELYSFLISFNQIRDNDDQLFLEMDCHKKLYCFKIFFDKGIRDHALQILQEVLEISSRHSLNTLYIEAINLRNTHFPLRHGRSGKKIPINGQIGKLKKTLGRNLYVNQYVTESVKSFHANDKDMRLKLIEEPACFDLAETEFVVEQLMEVNHLFCQRDYHSAYNKLLNLSRCDSDLSQDECILGLIYVELSKACICMNDLDTAMVWLQEAESVPANSPSMRCILVELRFIVSLRAEDPERCREILAEAKQLEEVRKSEELRAKWFCYSLYVSFQQKEFREVIKAVNAGNKLTIKSKTWLLNIRVLEMLSIFQLEDFDWLFYKIESFRKTVNGLDDKSERLICIVNLLKSQASGKNIADPEVDEKISLMEKQFAWDPLCVELIDLSKHAKILSLENNCVVLEDS